MTFQGHEMWWTNAEHPVFGRMWYCRDCHLWGYNQFTHISLGTGFEENEYKGEFS